MEPTSLRKPAKKSNLRAQAPGKKPEIAVPQPKTIDINEITAVITNLTVELSRKETELANVGATLGAERRRVEVLESILDKFLKPEWRSGDFEFVPDLLEPPTPAPAAPAPAPPAQPASTETTRVSDTE